METKIVEMKVDEHYQTLSLKTESGKWYMVELTPTEGE